METRHWGRWLKFVLFFVWRCWSQRPRRGECTIVSSLLTTFVWLNLLRRSYRPRATNLYNKKLSSKIYSQRLTMGRQVSFSNLHERSQKAGTRLNKNKCLPLYSMGIYSPWACRIILSPLLSHKTPIFTVAWLKIVPLLNFRIVNASIHLGILIEG